MRKSNYDIGNNNLKKIIDANKGTLEEIESAQSTADSNNDKMKSVADLFLQQSKWPAILNEIYRIKPDNLWITSLKPIIGPVKAFEVKSSSGMSEEDLMFGGNMFGGDMFEGDMGGMAGMGGGESTASVAQIGGLEIEGCCVQVDVNAFNFTLGPLGGFPFQVDKELPRPENADEATPENAQKLSPQELANKAVAEQMKKASDPAQAFLIALRMSQLFDSDEKMTTIINYIPSNDVQNYATFKMQLKFSMTVDFLQVKSGGTAKK